VAEGAKEASGFTRRAFRVRRKEETLRRQEKHTHSEAAEERSEGRNEPLSDWSAIVAGDVSVFPRPGRVCARLRLSQVRLGRHPLLEESLRKGKCCLRLRARSCRQSTANMLDMTKFFKPFVSLHHLHEDCLIIHIILRIQQVDRCLSGAVSVCNLGSHRS